MKTSFLKITILLILLGGTFGILACKTSKAKANSPEAVATKFLKHLAAYEFDECRKLGNDNTGKMIDMLQVLVEMSKEKGNDSILIAKERTITIVKTAVDGKVAVVTYLDESGIEQKLDMVKEEGKWLVDMKKETPLN
jgi:hypothetical protein